MTLATPVGPALDRRRLLQASAGFAAPALLGLGGCVYVGPRTIATPVPDPAFIPLAPIRASADRLFDITVCLRPFRAAGPRLEAETIGDALVIHNYGHGGSGWSLSWGSAAQAVRIATAGSPKRIAVIGCGVIGLTSAITAQEAGAQVTIYARDLLHATRSARATGTWTPDSRIALTTAAAPGFPARWEEMARTAWKTHRRYLGLPGEPVEWIDRYFASDPLPGPPAPSPAPPVSGPQLDFAAYGDRIAGLEPEGVDLAPGATLFAAARVGRSPGMIFNIADYGHTLLQDFRAAGGRIVRREFDSPAQFATLDEKVVINCPGYGGRALCRDESIMPVRGQIGWLPPQPEARYEVFYKHVGLISRRDGIVVQDLSGGDMRGYGDADETPDRAESEAAVARVAPLFRRFTAPPIAYK